MGNTVLCTIVLILYFTGILKTPRKKKENGFELLIVGTILLLSLTGLAALFFTIIGISVTFFSVTVFIFGMAAILWGRCIWKKEISNCLWPLTDAVSLMIVLAVVLAASIKHFGFNLNLNYSGVDSARYFQLAMDVLENKEVSGEFLTDLLNAMFIAFFKPFLSSISYYKAFIMADIFVHLLSEAMFYLLISKVNREKGKGWNTVLALLYFGGYPLYNLNSGGFMHWVDGMLMIMFLIYTTLLLMRREISKEKGILCLLCGLFGAICFYPILLVMVGPMILPEAVIWCKANMKCLSKKRLIALGILSLLVLGGIVLIVGQRVDYSWNKILSNLTVEGVIYREPYMDFLFFVPILFIFLRLLHRHKEANRSIARMIVVASVFMVIWFMFFLNGYVVAYYFYRFYYVLWLMAWLMTAQTIHLMSGEERKTEIGAYASFFAVVLVIAVSGVNEKIWNLSEELYQDESQKKVSLCPLYAMNWENIMSEQHSAISDTEYDLYDYVYKNYKDETVPMISSVYTNIQTEWYRGVTGQRFPKKIYDNRYYSLYGILRNLQNKEIRYAVILKSEPMYVNYYEEVFCHFDVVMENAGAVLYEMPEDGWSAVLDETDAITSQERAFFKEIRKQELQSSLVYDIYGLVQAEYFVIYTGGKIGNWIHRTAPEDFIANTYQLNIDEVEYLAVLKNSEIYKQNEDYFRSQEILFENEAGMLIAHTGTGWMPSEQE